MSFRCHSVEGFFLGFLLFISCTAPKKVHIADERPPVVFPAPLPKTTGLLEELMERYPQYFEDILKNRNNWNVQIIYTKVDRGGNGIPSLQTNYFNVDAARYFYPASAVKLPICLLALQKLNELKEKGIDRNTTMITETGNKVRSAVYNEPTAIDGRPTVAHYIKKLLVLNDSDAFNRLYAFLGQGYINAQMQKKGYPDVQILHGLNVFLSEEDNRRTDPITFLGENRTILYQQPIQYNSTKYAARKDSIGNAYYSAGRLVDRPMDFSTKNRISLQDLHTILTGIIFPEKIHSNQRFDISEDDRRFVLRYMSQYPQESTYPPYSAIAATYNRLLMAGVQKQVPSKDIRSFSVSGNGYGQMLETSYTIDTDKGVEYLLSATIYCNSDAILNDDRYDHGKLGLPFMDHLGEMIYDMEIKRPKKYRPDLSAFIFNYDK